VGLAVAEAVGKAAIEEGVSELRAGDLQSELRAYVWEPVYRPYEFIKAGC
jgi:hypothetical protein